ncbi:MAG: hypothetical protein EOP53_05495 [Sphingobacteriales bacterium]|nr:MAG: hypothetical protein EOP53_05495 [Sphingobacteriales bacterium]
MKNIIFASLFLVSAALYSCAGNENTEAQEEQVQTEQHDSLQNSVLDEADRTLREGNSDTTLNVSDSAGTMK